MPGKSRSFPFGFAQGQDDRFKGLADGGEKQHLIWSKWRDVMADTPKKDAGHKIDVTAPAGSEDSLGEESVRDGRPSTDDSVVEAMDEEGAGVEGRE
jgi:hypothetical protein